MKTISHSPLEPPMKSIANYATLQEPKLLNCRQFIGAVDGLNDFQLDALVHFMNANRMSVQLYEAMENLESPGMSKLRSHLKPSFDSHAERKQQRDILLRKMVEVFGEAGIDYVVFKTLNSSGWIGVDIDVVIAPSNYDLCVRVLLKNGFYSIDDLSKKYATGFMIRGNPIIVDLHTELAILGVRYLSAELLLQNKKSATIRGGQGFDSFALNISNETVETLARIAHSILKEGVITLGEFQEVCRVPTSSVVDYIAKEGLQLSASIFAYRTLCLQNTEQLTSLLMFKENFLHYLARDILVNSTQDTVPPFKIPVAVCALAFMDRLKNKGELGKYAPTLLYSFKFRRNAAHLGHKLLERFVAS
jgi:hypothetical protein